MAYFMVLGFDFHMHCSVIEVFCKVSNMIFIIHVFGDIIIYLRSVGFNFLEVPAWS